MALGVGVGAGGIDVVPALGRHDRGEALIVAKGAHKAPAVGGEAVGADVKGLGTLSNGRQPGGVEFQHLIEARGVGGLAVGVDMVGAAGRDGESRAHGAPPAGLRILHPTQSGRRV